MAHLVGGQLPNGHESDDLAEPVKPNVLPDGEIQMEKTKGTEETSSDNNYPHPMRLA